MKAVSQRNVPQHAVHGIDRMIRNIETGRFFTPAEEAIATVLCDHLVGQYSEPRLPVVHFIDARLADGETDGWRYADMPEDGQAWRDCLHDLDADAHANYGGGFVQCEATEQRAIIQAVQDLGSADWHGRSAAHVWSLWTRYACTVLHAHPSAWTEIGWAG